MNNSIADKINDCITMPEALKRYGYEINRVRRIPCPIHKGKDANFCYTDKVFHCWTCGAKGNVISFVMQCFELTFGQALLKINVDFSLGLTAKKMTTRERCQQIENRKIQKAFICWKAEKNKKYLEVVNAYSVLFRQLQLESENETLKSYVADLELWLDQNIEEVRL